MEGPLSVFLNVIDEIQNVEWKWFDEMSFVLEGFSKFSILKLFPVTYQKT